MLAKKKEKGGVMYFVASRQDSFRARERGALANALNWRIPLLFGALATMFFADAEDRKWCLTDSQYQDVYTGTVADLRWSFFAISQLATTKDVDVTLLNGLADESVISLANTLSLRARYLQKCDLSQEDYFRLLGENRRFASLLVSITSSEKFPAADRIKEKYPELLLLGDTESVIAKKQLPIDPTLRQRLELLRKEVPDAPSDPYFVAISQLLGVGLSWQERELKATNIILVNSNNPYPKMSFQEWLSVVKDKESVALLWGLRHYYKLTELPQGAPGSLLH